MVLAVRLVLFGSVQGEEDVAQPNAVEHWAYQRPVRPKLPTGGFVAGSRNAIDTFVLQHLTTVGVQPSPPANSTTLIRRLWLDVVGLPPSLEAVERFVTDPSPDAPDRAVDRLLASPHYGERWGRNWLDLARYADSDGYTLDSPRPWAWRWRDWVINAFNSDMPFDQFTIEQLGGDLLPDASIEQHVATGFHRNTLRNAEGGVDKEEYRIRAVVDRANTTGTVWLATTIGCCQCHDHMYDPLSQREYYEFFAFFNNDDDVLIAANQPLQEEQYQRALSQLDPEEFENITSRLQAAIDERVLEIPRVLQEWESARTPVERQWTALTPKTYGATGSRTQMEILEDGSMLIGGPNTFFNNFSLSFETTLEGLTGLRLEVLPHETQPEAGPGRDDRGDFFLSELRVATRPLGDLNASDEPAVISAAYADFEKSGNQIAHVLDGDTETGWSIGTETGRHHTAMFVFEKPLGGARGSTIILGLDHQGYTIGRFRLLVTNEVPLGSELSSQFSKGLSEEEALPQPIAALLAQPVGQRNAGEQQQLQDFFATIDPPLRELRRQLLQHNRNRPQPPNTQARTLAARGDRKTFLHVRGDFRRPGEEVTPGTPAILPTLFSEGAISNRLELARWIVDVENPLTRRVFSNRIWQRLFGRALVRTPDDFGTMGETATHPELLDFLACEVSRLGWSRKMILRQIVASNTYRQSSSVREELVTKDPDNLLLARQNRYRLEGEVIRDGGLTVSGLLTRQIGGPSIHPPLPGKVGDIGFANLVPWQVSAGAAQYRRGIYIFSQRTVPYPMLNLFDVPDMTVTCTRREVSNTPLHALFLLNDPVFTEFARDFARRLLQEPGDVSTRMRRGYQMTTARRPSPDQLQALREFYTKVRNHFEAFPAAAREFAGAAESSAGTVEHATWTAVCRALLNTDQFLTRE